MKKILLILKSILNFFLTFKKKKNEDQKEESKPIVKIPEQVTEVLPAIFDYITDQDKIQILDIIRPMIRDLNSSSPYLNLCKVFLENRILKTYTTFSEDRRALIVNFTQNETFNEKLSDFISHNVVSKFQDEINSVIPDTYQVSSENGAIFIKKLKK